MKKIMSIILMSFLFSVLLHQKLYAADAGQFYVGVDFGSSRITGDGPKNNIAFIPNQNFRASDSAYGLHAGFQFNNWSAMELGLKDYGRASHAFKIRDDIFFLDEPNSAQTVDAKGASLLGVFSYPINPRISLLGVAGITSVDVGITQSGGYSPFIGSLYEKDSVSEQGLVIGFGATYALWDSLDIRAELRRDEAGDFTLDTATLGLEYSF